MSDFFELMGRPILACLILTGIHVYLGLHVLARQVIFADLAMAQVAALGSSIGFVIGLGTHSIEGFLMSIGVTAIAALIFAVIHKSKSLEVPREAYIGVIYAVAAALTIIALNYLPEGGEELKAKAVGHLLFVSKEEILTMLVVYALVGGFHFAFRNQFWAASTGKGHTKFHWHYLFYLSLGIVVTSSVEVGGVLLVFSILIVPVLCASIFTGDYRSRLLIGWLISFLVCSLGTFFSYQFDLPTGATIVAIFGLALISALGVKRALFS